MDKNQLKKFIIQDLDKVYSDLMLFYDKVDQETHIEILQLIDDLQNKIEELN
jgi:hypothetical protein